MAAPMERARSGASFLSTASHGAAYSASAPALPLYPSPESLAPHLGLPAHDLQPLLRHALLAAARNAEPELVQWLLDLPPDVRAALPLDATDADDGGCGPVALAVLGSAGREDREECVRALVRAVGVGGADHAGWTALHHAALLSTPPLISFLLTAGADPHAVTHKGLTPLDIVTDLPAHTDQTALLTTAMTSPPVPPLAPSAFGSPSAISEAAFPASSSSPSSSSTTAARAPTLRRQPTASTLPAAVARAQLHRRAENRRRVRLEKERWMADVAIVAGVDREALLDRCWEDDDGEVDADEEKLRRRKRAGRQGSTVAKEMTGYSSGEDGSSDDGSDDDFDPSQLPPYHSFLVFSLPTLPSLLDTLIASYAPHAHPRAWRAAPANAILLFARFALYRCDDEWLEELVVGVVDRVEKSVYDNVDDLAHLAFWIYNATLLLHLLRQDPGLNLACDELNLFIMLEELINAIHVFVIRFIERRVDGYLDAALLDHEPMDEFAGLSFEGEWSFLKNLTGRGATTAKKAAERIVPKAKDMFAASPARTDGAGGEGWPASGEAGRQRSQTSFQSGGGGGGGSPRQETAVPTGGRPASVGDFSAVSRSFSSTSSLYLGGPSPPPGNPRRVSDEPPAAPPPPPGTEAVTPRTLTTFLTSALVILQLYEVNPAVICQALSQVVYWVGCEVFNRILTRRRYLCRSKAVQIRMNLTALEDWLRDAGLPVRIATRHLEPVNQLLQWLQTCSSLDDFDSLIVMLSSLRSLNPLQMRRAVKDYRFETGEGRMSDECAQYLAQLQKDWDKRRVRIGVETLQREVSEQERLRVDVYGSHDGPSLVPAEDRPYNPALLEPATAIDLLFDPDVPLGQYNPPSAPESLGELLDSRFMLPFTLPQDDELLAATPPKGAAFALLLPPGADGSATQYLPSLPLASPRPSSRSSFASLRPLRYASRKHQPINELPLEFLEWLDEEERAKAPRERRLGSALDSLRSGASISVDPAAHGQDRTPTDTRPSNGAGLHADDTFRRGSSSRDDSTLVAGGGGGAGLSPPTADVDDFGSRRGSAHNRGDSEQTISSHGRDTSDATVKSKPGRLASLIVDDGGAYRPTTTVDRDDDDDDDARTPVSSSKGGGQPASPSSAKGWFKSLPRRKGTLKALINGGGST